jgi:hypothetical protein
MCRKVRLGTGQLLECSRPCLTGVLSSDRGDEPFSDVETESIPTHWALPQFLGTHADTSTRREVTSAAGDALLARSEKTGPCGRLRAEVQNATMSNFEISRREFVSRVAVLTGGLTAGLRVQRAAASEGTEGKPLRVVVGPHTHKIV